MIDRAKEKFEVFTDFIALVLAMLLICSVIGFFGFLFASAFFLGFGLVGSLILLAAAVLTKFLMKFSST